MWTGFGQARKPKFLPDLPDKDQENNNMPETSV
jgi:hypothetical protein